MANRKNFYYKQRITDSDLNEAFDEFEVSDRNIVKDFKMYGIVSGFKVRAERQDLPQLSVEICFDRSLGEQSSAAYDILGRRISIPEERHRIDVDASKIPTEDGMSRWASICVQHRKVASQEVKDGLGRITHSVEYDDFFTKIIYGAESKGSPSRPTVKRQDGEVLICDILLNSGDERVLTGNMDLSRRDSYVSISDESISYGESFLSDKLLELDSKISEIRRLAELLDVDSAGIDSQIRQAESAIEENSSTATAEMDALISEAEAHMNTRGVLPNSQRHLSNAINHTENKTVKSKLDGVLSSIDNGTITTRARKSELSADLEDHYMFGEGAFSPSWWKAETAGSMRGYILPQESSSDGIKEEKSLNKALKDTAALSLVGIRGSNFGLCRMLGDKLWDKERAWNQRQLLVQQRIPLNKGRTTSVAFLSGRPLDPSEPRVSRDSEVSPTHVFHTYQGGNERAPSWVYQLKDLPIYLSGVEIIGVAPSGAQVDSYISDNAPMSLKKNFVDKAWYPNKYDEEGLLCSPPEIKIERVQVGGNTDGGQKTYEDYVVSFKWDPDREGYNSPYNSAEIVVNFYGNYMNNEVLNLPTGQKYPKLSVVQPELNYGMKSDLSDSGLTSKKVRAYGDNADIWINEERLEDILSAMGDEDWNAWV